MIEYIVIEEDGVTPITTEEDDGFLLTEESGEEEIPPITQVVTPQGGMRW